MEEPTTTTILLPPTSTTGTNYEGELKSTNKLPCQRVLFLHSDAGGLTISSFLREQGFQEQDENVTLYDLSSENCDRVINEKAEHMNVFRPEIMIGYDKGANVAVEMIRRGCFSGPTVLLSLRVEELTNLELPSTVSVVLVHGTQDSEVPITLAQQMVQQNDPLVGTSFAFVQVDDTHSLINITTSSQEGVQAPLLTYIDTAWKMKDRMATELLQKERTPTMPRPAPESVIAPPPPTSTRPGETSPEVTPNIVAADVAGVTTPGTVITNVEHLPIAGETVTAVVLPHDTTETKTEAPPSAGTTTTTEAGETTAAGATSAQTSKGGTSPQTSPTIGRKEQQAPKSPGKEGGNLHRLANAARKTKCTIQ